MATMALSPDAHVYDLHSHDSLSTTAFTTYIIGAYGVFWWSGVYRNARSRIVLPVVRRHSRLLLCALSSPS